MQTLRCTCRNEIRIEDGAGAGFIACPCGTVLKVERPKSLGTAGHTKPAAGFCDTCLSSSLPNKSGDTFSLMGIGTTLRGRSHQCTICGSAIARKWVIFYWIPIFPLDRYRALWGNETFGIPFSSRPLLSRWVPPFIDE